MSEVPPGQRPRLFEALRSVGLPQNDAHAEALLVFGDQVGWDWKSVRSKQLNMFALALKGAGSIDIFRDVCVGKIQVRSLLPQRN